MFSVVAHSFDGCLNAVDMECHVGSSHLSISTS